jgi:hypothetical protein
MQRALNDKANISSMEKLLSLKTDMTYTKDAMRTKANAEDVAIELERIYEEKVARDAQTWPSCMQSAGLDLVLVIYTIR